MKITALFLASAIVGSANAGYSSLFNLRGQAEPETKTLEATISLHGIEDLTSLDIEMLGETAIGAYKSAYGSDLIKFVANSAATVEGCGGCRDDDLMKVASSTVLSVTMDVDAKLGG